MTNDDGVDSPGIHALAEKLAELGEVTVVAPAQEASGVSHALTLSEPLRYEQLEERTFSVEGTPTDCVNLAVRSLLPYPPDLLVSGINRGANLGDDVTYSGTVAAAMEGSMLGITSFAVSLVSKTSEDFGTASAFAVQLAEIVTSKKLPPQTFLNVNVPTGDIEGIRITNQAGNGFRAQADKRANARPGMFSWLKQGSGRWERNGLSDIAAVQDNLISVTPLHADFTNYSALDELASWGLNWNGGPRDRDR